LATLPEDQAKKAIEKEANRLFLEAEGTPLGRSAIVCVMMPLGETEFRTVRDKLPKTDQDIFTMTFAAALLWAVQQGSDQLEPDDAKATAFCVGRHLTKQSWFKQEIFQRIWAQIEILMPIAFSEEPGAPPPYPLAEIMMAAEFAGHKVNVVAGMDFGMFIAFTLVQTTKIARMTVDRYLKEAKSR
jgi:hypothetical protein